MSSSIKNDIVPCTTVNELKGAQHAIVVVIDIVSPRCNNLFSAVIVVLNPLYKIQSSGVASMFLDF